MLFFSSRAVEFTLSIVDASSNKNICSKDKFFINPYNILIPIVFKRINFIYKNRLKILVKSSYGKHIGSLIRSLNKEIKAWSVFCSLFYVKATICRELDLFLYKILWKFVKRCHPRRSNSWIYAKYWKFYSGTARFLFSNVVTGKLHFLKLHQFIYFSTYSLPLSTEVFNYFNRKKIFSSLFKASRVYFKGFYKALFIKQKGLCYFCLNPIEFSNYELIKNVNKGYVKFESLNYYILIHRHCRP